MRSLRARLFPCDSADIFGSSHLYKIPPNPDAAALIREMRISGIRQPVFGPSRIASPLLTGSSGIAADVVAALRWHVIILLAKMKRFVVIDH